MEAKHYHVYFHSLLCTVFPNDCICRVLQRCDQGSVERKIMLKLKPQCRRVVNMTGDLVDKFTRNRIHDAMHEYLAMMNDCPRLIYMRLKGDHDNTFPVREGYSYQEVDDERRKFLLDELETEKVFHIQFNKDYSTAYILHINYY